MIFIRRSTITKKILIVCTLFCHYATNSTVKEPENLLINLPREISNQIVSYYIDALLLPNSDIHISLCETNKFFCESFFDHHGISISIQNHAIQKKTQQKLFGYIRNTPYGHLAKTYIICTILDWRSKASLKLSSTFCNHVNMCYHELLNCWNAFTAHNKRPMNIKRNTHLITFCHKTKHFIYRGYEHGMTNYQSSHGTQSEEIVKFFCPFFNVSTLKHDPLIEKLWIII